MAAPTMLRRRSPPSPRVTVLCEPPLYGQFLVGNFRTADYRTSCTYMGRWVIMRPFTQGGSMAEWSTLAEAIGAHVHDGETIAMEGFTHLIPFAAGHEII